MLLNILPDILILFNGHHHIRYHARHQQHHQGRTGSQLESPLPVLLPPVPDEAHSGQEAPDEAEHVRHHADVVHPAHRDGVNNINADENYQCQQFQQSQKFPMPHMLLFSSSYPTWQ